MFDYLKTTSLWAKILLAGLGIFGILITLQTLINSHTDNGLLLAFVICSIAVTGLAVVINHQSFEMKGDDNEDS